MGPTAAQTLGWMLLDGRTRGCEVDAGSGCPVSMSTTHCRRGAGGHTDRRAVSWSRRVWVGCAPTLRGRPPRSAAGRASSGIDRCGQLLRLPVADRPSRRTAHVGSGQDNPRMDEAACKGSRGRQTQIVLVSSRQAA